MGSVWYCGGVFLTFFFVVTMAAPGSPNVAPKKETFNQLDEQFRVLDHHDPEIIFPAELEMIKEMRIHRPELVRQFICVHVIFRPTHVGL